jgi:hypothetical protein
MGDVIPGNGGSYRETRRDTEGDMNRCVNCGELAEDNSRANFGGWLCQKHVDERIDRAVQADRDALTGCADRHYEYDWDAIDAAMGNDDDPDNDPDRVWIPCGDEDFYVDVPRRESQEAMCAATQLKKVVTTEYLGKEGAMKVQLSQKEKAILRRESARVDWLRRHRPNDRRARAIAERRIDGLFH